ncbi:MAG: S8 family serine peptidase, partial [Planctomycetota bacterium]
MRSIPAAATFAATTAVLGLTPGVLAEPPLPAFAPGQVVVMADHRHDDLAAFAGGVCDAAGLDAELIKTASCGRALLLSVAAGTEHAACAALARQPGVAFAELNGVGTGGTGWGVAAEPATRAGTGTTALPPNDWGYRFSWQHTGSNGMDSELAWARTTGDPSIVIAVLDTGIDPTHNEFAGRIAPGEFDFVNTDPVANADHPHGIHVSGMAMANANNGFQFTGVDWNARVLPIKVLDNNNSGFTFDAYEGLLHAAADPAVRIVSLSLIRYPASSLWDQGIAACRNAGQIVIACAGNDGPGDADVSFPGAHPQSISIGWTGEDGFRNNSSGTGDALDLVAPGSRVPGLSEVNRFDAGFFHFGCSFATPHTAGVVGLLLAEADRVGIRLSHDQVRGLLIGGAQPSPDPNDIFGDDAFYGHGIVNAAGTLRAFDDQIIANRCSAADLA